MDSKNHFVELLAPAGSFEKMEIAIHFGADAVYIGGKQFSLRNFSGNFSIPEIKKAVSYAHERGVSIYTACNVFARSSEEKALSEYFKQLGEAGPDAIIIADPGVFRMAKKRLPHIPIHISTQANTTSLSTVRFWENLGIKRINLARELSMEEIAYITSRTDVEIEVFIHGAMCIAYSGRCLLSGYMAARESNRGECCQPCRFNYHVVEETRPGQYFNIREDERGSYIFSSKDLCMIRHIPEILESGVRSVKIEGRMKGINYVGTVIKAYREAIDSASRKSGKYDYKPEWLSLLQSVGPRGFCTGFFFGDPREGGQAYEAPKQQPRIVFAGKVIRNMSNGLVEIDVRNRFASGDQLEILSPGKPVISKLVREIRDKHGIRVKDAPTGTRRMIDIDYPCEPNDLIRKMENI